MFLLTQFLFVNGHFTLNLFAALVAFAVSWLYFDAWLGTKSSKEGTKSLGFILLSISFVAHATSIDQSLLATSFLGANTIFFLTALFRISGYLVLIIGQTTDPLQPLPAYRTKKAGQFVMIASAVTVSELVPMSFPILAVIAAFLYLRRSTVGLEHHLKPISLSLFILSVSELATLAATFRTTSNVAISNLVAPFGPIWITEQFLLLISMLILGIWVWGYLIKRIETQLLMIFTISTLTIFLITTIFFTTTTIKNLQTETLKNLKISVNVLNFSIESKKSETLSDAQVIAQNPKVITSVVEKDKKNLTDLTSSILLAKKQSFLTVVTQTGEILVRADDPDKVGGSLSDDPLIKKALEGSDSSSVVVKDGVLAPEVSIRSTTPINTSEGVVGAVLVGTVIDNAFVDGLKDSTGLDASIYGDNIRSATTFIAPDGKSRWIGIKEESEEIKKSVLIDGNTFTGSVNILNVPHFTAFFPLKDVDDNPVGMLFVGQPQTSLFKAASKSIELTFLVSAGLLVLSIIPAYFISKHIVNQISHY